MIFNPFSSGLAAGLRRMGVGAAIVVTIAVVGSSARGQGYSTGFEVYSNGTTPYQAGASLSGQDGWDTTDQSTILVSNTENVGQSDFVGTVPGYTNAATGNWAYLGGGQHDPTPGSNPASYVLPSVPTSYLLHPLSVASATNYAFNVDFSLARNLGTVTPQTASDKVRDSFGWTFLSGNSGTAIGSNLFSLNFTPAGTADHMDINYSLNGVVNPAMPVYALLNNSIYHLTISVNVATKRLSATLTPTTNGGPAITVIDNLLLTGTFAANPTAVQSVAATWILNGNPATKDPAGGYTSAGSNEMIFNNYAVTVPEPSTWAMLGLGAVAAVGMARRRARA